MTPHPRFFHFQYASFGRAAGFVVCLCLALTANATDDLAQWRNEISRVRDLAENDARRAYTEAQRLQAAQPTLTTPADQALALNLLARVEIYLALTDQAALHAEQAMAIASSAQDAVGQAEADLNIALNSVNQGDIDKSIKVTTHALTILRDVNRPDLLGEALLRSGNMYYRVGKLEESVPVFLQALEIAKRSGNARILAYAHQGMGIVLDQSDRPAEAIDHFAAMRQQAQAAHSKLLEAYALSGMANVQIKLGDYTHAEPNTQQALALYREVGTPFSINFGQFALVTIFKQQGRFADALPLFDDIFSTYAQYPNRLGEWYTLNARSDIYLTLGRRADALADAKKAYELAQKISFWRYLSESQRRLASFAALAHNYEEAYRFAAEAEQTQVTAQRALVSKRMGEAAQRYADESRQREIVELTHRNEQQQAKLQRHALWQRWIWTVLGSSVLVMIIALAFAVHLRRSNRLLIAANQELIQSRNELQQQTTLLQSVLNSMTEAVAVIDDQDELILANPAFARYLGMESMSDELIQLVRHTKLTCSYLPDQRTPYPFDQLPLRRALAGEQVTDATLCVRPPKVPGTHWFNCSAQPLRDSQGRVYAAVAVFSDITLARQTQEQLRASERKFRTLVESLPDVVTRYDRSCQQLYANPAYQLNVELAGNDILPQRVDSDCCIGAHSGVFFRHIQHVIATGRGAEFAISWAAQDGKTHTWAMQIVAEHEVSGRIMGVVVIGRDVTALQEAQNSLEQSRDQLRALTAAREKSREEERKRIAHEIHDELGQLLTALRMRLAMLRMQLKVNTPFAEPIHELMELTDNIIHVVRNVAAALRPPVLDAGLIAALEWLTQQQTKLTGVVCRLQLPAPRSFDIDDERATALFRIVQESLTNITRHAQASQIVILLDCENGVGSLEVRDNGIGFDKSSARKGLGLVGMNERALMLGGSIDIASCSQGTKIRVCFPL